MKKMFFTAIALVAFSATSMANTAEVKEVTISEGEKEVVVKKSCLDIMLDVYEFFMDYECGEIGSGCGGDDQVLLNELVGLCN
jgi:hypothetical protein